MDCSRRNLLALSAVIGGLAWHQAAHAQGASKSTGPAEKPKGPVAAMPPTEQIMYSAIRIIVPLSSETWSTGTGFFFNFFVDGDRAISTIITNRHVIASGDTVNLTFNQDNGSGSPIIGKTITYTITDLPMRLILHPSADLAVIFIGDIINKLRIEGRPPYMIFLTRDLIPEEKALNSLTPTEAVLTVGFPGQVWDSTHNLPLFHRGYTATPPYIDFNGRPEFMVDFTTWPGASGSPMFLFEEGSWFDRNGGGPTLGGIRANLLGVVYGVTQQNLEGDIVVVEAPTKITKTPLKAEVLSPTNLGACIRSTVILDFEPIMAKRGAKVPSGYKMRSALNP